MTMNNKAVCKISNVSRIKKRGGGLGLYTHVWRINDEQEGRILEEEDWARVIIFYFLCLFTLKPVSALLKYVKVKYKQSLFQFIFMRDFFAQWAKSYLGHLSGKVFFQDKFNFVKNFRIYIFVHWYYVIVCLLLKLNCIVAQRLIGEKLDIV